MKLGRGPRRYKVKSEILLAFSKTDEENETIPAVYYFEELQQKIRLVIA